MIRSRVGRLLALGALIVGGIIEASSTASADVFTTVDFSNQANFTWVSHAETDPSGPTNIYFPGGPLGPNTFNGIPFDITSNTEGNQAWNSWTASGGSDAVQTLTIPVNVFGVKDVYTLINTYWGRSGVPTALTFT